MLDLYAFAPKFRFLPHGPAEEPAWEVVMLTSILRWIAVEGGGEKMGRAGTAGTVVSWRASPVLNPSFWELKALLCTAPLNHSLLQTTPLLATPLTALLETHLG